MRQITKIVRDKNNDVYLKVYDRNMKGFVCFQILPFGDSPEGELTDLSDTFSINLNEFKGGE